MLQRGHNGDGCDLALTLCKYDLRKGDLFVVSWARVRRVSRGGKYLFRAVNVWWRYAQCFVTIDVCIWSIYVFMSVVVIVWGSVGMFVV